MMAVVVAGNAAVIIVVKLKNLKSFNDRSDKVVVVGARSQMLKLSKSNSR